MHKFYENPYLTEIKTIVTGVFSENDQNCVQVADNIFYPRGGGQKGDKGLLSVQGINYNIVDTVKDGSYTIQPYLIIRTIVFLSLRT